MFGKDNGKVIQVKINFNEDLRRFSLPENATFAELTTLMGKLYSLPNSVTVKYMDDEKDLISITSDEELVEAMRLAISSNPPILRLFVYAAPQLIFSKIAKEPVAPIPAPQPMYRLNTTTVPSTEDATLPPTEERVIVVPVITPSSSAPVLEKPKVIRVETPTERVVVVQENVYVSPKVPESISRQVAAQCIDLARQTANSCQKISYEVRMQGADDTNEQWVKLSMDTSSLLQRVADNTAAQCQQTSDETMATLAQIRRIPEAKREGTDSGLKQFCAGLVTETAEQCKKIGDALSMNCAQLSSETTSQLQKISDDIAAVCKEISGQNIAGSNNVQSKSCNDLANQVSSQCGCLSSATSNTCLQEAKSIRDLIMGIKVSGL